MSGLGIFLLIIVAVIWLWPYISRWLRRKANERIEDYIRKATGMPPREKKKRNHKSSGSDSDNSFYNQRHQRYSPGAEEPLIPKEYAEDVEFVETKDYSESFRQSVRDAKTSYHESQVSDAEYVEIKDRKDIHKHN